MTNWTQEELCYLRECYGILSVNQIAAHLGRSIGSVSGYATKLDLTHRDPPKVSICWNCAHATGGCSWSRNFTPVIGWTAKQTALRAFNNTCTASYQVERCPEFQPDEPAERTT